ncbi:hypothetical protein HDV63DRAFT_308932 [Trichoderma sp. SZMC 28014]
MEIVHRPREDARSASGEKICMARPNMALLERSDNATASSASDPRDLAVVKRPGGLRSLSLTAAATAQPEIRRRTFSPHVRCGRRALKRPVSVDCVASTASSPSAQGPGRCFGACRGRDWRFCRRSRRGSVQFEILIRRPRANHTLFDLPGTDKRGKFHKRHQKKRQGWQGAESQLTFRRRQKQP